MVQDENQIFTLHHPAKNSKKLNPTQDRCSHIIQNGNSKETLSPLPW
jgi:hypothetical protein